MQVQVFISLEIILTSARKTQVEFRSHFSGKKVRLMGREIWYLVRISAFFINENTDMILMKLSTEAYFIKVAQKF